jgi:hypothetical protein
VVARDGVSLAVRHVTVLLFLGADPNQGQTESNPLDPELKPLYSQVVEKLTF